MLSVKQGSIKYCFLSLWYDSAWDLTQVSQAIGEHSNHYAYKYKSYCLHGDILNIAPIFNSKPREYVFTKPLHNGEVVIQSQFLI